MGFLYYAGVSEFEFDDRILAHLKAAAGSKLRRQESFFLNWAHSPEQGSGRISVWVSPATPLIFRFLGNTPPRLNQAWVQALVATANTPRGMTLMREDQVEPIPEVPGGTATR